jgi:hypothetical protein
MEGSMRRMEQRRGVIGECPATILDGLRREWVVKIWRRTWKGMGSIPQRLKPELKMEQFSQR